MPNIEHSYTEREETVARNLDMLRRSGLAFKGKRILDLGCGTGAYAAGMARAGAAHVVGVDVAPANIALAGERFALPNLQFMQADVLAADLEGPYDLVFMRGTVYYLPVPFGRALATIAALVAPRGALFMTMLAPTPRARAVNMLKRCAAATPAALRPLVREAAAGLYWLLARLASAGGADRTTIRGKMNTLFFPAHHLLAPEAMADHMRRLGFDVDVLADAQGEHPQLSDEYGIICTRAEARPRRGQTPPNNETAQ